jgi:hypothetical protein
MEREGVKMTITEVVQRPAHIRSDLAAFERQAFFDFRRAIAADQELSNRVADLHRQLVSIIECCTDDLSPAATAVLIESWDEWCDAFQGLEHPLFEEQILDTFVALPS